MSNGGELAFGQQAVAIDERSDEVVVETTQGVWHGAKLVASAGLQADRLARLAGLEVSCAGGPFRGDCSPSSGGAAEVTHALSWRVCPRAARHYCSNLRLDDLAMKSCGVCARAVSRTGEMLHDFLFQTTRHSVHVLNTPSPAATSAFPIARAIVERLQTSRIS